MMKMEYGIILFQETKKRRKFLILEYLSHSDTKESERQSPGEVNLICRSQIVSEENVVRYNCHKYFSKTSVVQGHKSQPLKKLKILSIQWFKRAIQTSLPSEMKGAKPVEQMLFNDK